MFFLHSLAIHTHWNFCHNNLTGGCICHFQTVTALGKIVNLDVPICSIFYIELILNNHRFTNQTQSPNKKVFERLQHEGREWETRNQTINTARRRSRKWNGNYWWKVIMQPTSSSPVSHLFSMCIIQFTHLSSPSGYIRISCGHNQQMTTMGGKRLFLLICFTSMLPSAASSGYENWQ